MSSFGDAVLAALEEVEQTARQYETVDGTELAAMAVYESFDEQIRTAMFSVLLNRYLNLKNITDGIMGAIEDMSAKGQL